MTSRQPKTTEVLNRFASAGIRYCHWKSNEHLVAGLTGKTDLDVLVEQQREVETRSILQDANWLPMVSRVGYDGIEDWLGFDEVTGALYHLHLHFTLRTGTPGEKQFRLPWEEYILNHRATHRTGIAIPDAALEAVLLWVRLALKYSPAKLTILRAAGRLPGRFHEEHSYLRAQTSADAIHRHAAVLLSSRAADKLAQLTSSQEVPRLAQLLSFQQIILKDFKTPEFFAPKRTKIATDPEFEPLRAAAQFSKPGKLLAPSGALIAVIGVDGAGKSTITRALAMWLGWKLDTSLFYLGTGASGSRRGLSLLSRAILKLPGAHRVRLAKRRTSRYRAFRAAHRLAAAGGLVITDRYPQAQFAGRFDGPPHATEHRPMLDLSRTQLESSRFDYYQQHLPNIVLRLNLDPSIALQRKPSSCPTDVRAKHQIQRRLDFPGSHVIDVDAGRTFEDVWHDVKRGVWSALVSLNESN